MKKYLGRTWAKILAMILLIFAIFMTAFGTFLLILNAEIGEAGLERHFYTICGNSYSAWLFSQEGGIMGDPAMLEGSNMEYAIAESKDGNPNSLDMTDPNVFLYHTPGYKDYINVFVGNDAYDYDYRIDSFPGAWLHGVRPYGEDFYYDDSGAGAVEDKYYIIFYNVKDPLISSEEYSDLFTEAKSASDTLISFMHHASVPMFVCGIILTVLSFVWLMKSAGRRAYDDQIHTRMADRIPFGLYLSGVFILELMGTGCTVSLFQEIGYGPGLTYTILIGLLILGIIAGMIILGMLFMMSIAARVKSKTFARYSLCHYLKHGFIRFRKAVNVHTSLMVRSIALIAILTILQLFVICVTEYDLGFEIVSFIIYKCVEIPLFIYAMFQIAKIIRGT
ncbi:MAG: hypothetical protein IKE02_00090, partial [Lachnospiraceae bacterium]|nr:hypothetical protein [Lachnospiraceae bacterium]